MLYPCADGWYVGSHMTARPSKKNIKNEQNQKNRLICSIGALVIRKGKINERKPRKLYTFRLCQRWICFLVGFVSASFFLVIVWLCQGIFWFVYLFSVNGTRGDSKKIFWRETWRNELYKYVVGKIFVKLNFLQKYSCVQEKLSFTND